MVLNCDADDVDEDQYCHDSGDGPAAGRAAAFDGNGSYAYIGDQENDFGQDPRL